jgi:two-component system, OmpR family, KDP operon response regulator KdpE
MKFLIVDDDPRLREALVAGLQLQWEDAEVLEAADGEAGLRLAFDATPDVVLLDVTMPRMSGFEALKEIRRVSDVPVILLTARGEEMDQVRGLELGADDYLIKPVKHAALMARIKAVLRRSELPMPSEAAPDFVAGDLAVNFQAQSVRVAGEPVRLTPVEFKLLYHLVRNAGRLLPHRALLDRVWGSDYDASPEYLKVFVSRLRAKLRRSGGPEYIQTERGVGYRFVKPSPRLAALVEEEQAVGNEPQPAVWLAVNRVDPSPETRNSRRAYDQTRLRELADSIREQGILQPILVAPVGDRYEVIAGNRRLRAATLLGLDRIPAVVRSGLDERRRLLVNLVENAQRVDLSPTERIEAVRHLAASGMGVREIARGTGLSPGTVSRWIRIAGNTPVLRALEEGRIDLFRAMHLTVLHDEATLEELIGVASEYAPDAFYSLVQQRVAGRNTHVDRDERRLALLAERLSRVESVTPAAVGHLQRIIETASRLVDRARCPDGASRSRAAPKRAANGP